MPDAYVLIHRLFQLVMYRCRDRVDRCIESFAFHVLMHDSCASMHTEQKEFCDIPHAVCIDAQTYVLMHTDTKWIL